MTIDEKHFFLLELRIGLRTELKLFWMKLLLIDSIGLFYDFNDLLKGKRLFGSKRLLARADSGNSASRVFCLPLL